jgi:hypothetical protein
MNTNTIQITLEVDDKGTVKIKQFGDQLKGLPESAEKTSSGFDSLNTTWVAAAAKITAVTAAIYAGKKALESLVGEAAEAEQIENRLKFALETSGHSWTTLKTAVDAYATSIQMNTRFSDEQARQALTDMMMYTKDFTQVQLGANLAMDMSVRTGHDLSTSTHLIGMAMAGNVEMLGRYIPEFRDLDKTLGDNASNAQKAEYAIRILQEKFGGTARNDINSYAGSVFQLKNSWSDLKEEIAKGFLPTLRDSARETKELVDSVKEHWENAKTIIEWAYKLSPVGMGAEIGKWTRQKIQEFQIATGATRPDWSKSYELFTAESERLLRGAAAGLPGKEYPMMKMPSDMWDYFKETQGFITIIEGEIKELIPVIKDYESIWEKLFRIPTLTTYEDIERQLVAFGVVLGEDKIQITEWSDTLGKNVTVVQNAVGYYKSLKDRMDEILNTAELLSTIRMAPGGPWTGAEFTFPTEDILPDWMVHPKTGKPILVDEWKKQLNQNQILFDGFVSNISSSFQAGFFDLFKSGENKWDSFCDNMRNSFLRALSQMATNYLMFGNLLGGGYGSAYAKTPSGGTGWLGFLGTFGSWLGLQEGGQFWANRPTPLVVGEGGQREFVTVTPESKMGRTGGTTVIHYHNHNYSLYCQDLQTARDFLRRNRSSFLEIIQEDADEGGPMRHLGS